MSRLAWAFVGPFNSLYPETLADRANLQAHLGLCWRLLGLKFQSQRKHGSVEVQFWVHFGLVLGHLEAILSSCLEYIRQPALVWQRECKKKAFFNVYVYMRVYMYMCEKMSVCLYFYIYTVYILADVCLYFLYIYIYVYVCIHVKIFNVN